MLLREKLCRKTTKTIPVIVIPATATVNVLQVKETTAEFHRGDPVHLLLVEARGRSHVGQAHRAERKWLLPLIKAICSGRLILVLFGG